MYIFVIAVGAVMLPIIFGGLLAFGTSRLDAVVTSSREEVESRDKGYNPGLTLGHKIKVGLDTEAQLKEARMLAAQKAASIPRGANMRIGRLGQSTLKTAGKALEEDPWTAVKIAQFHGFDGAKMGTAAAEAMAGAPGVATTTTVVPGGKIELVPGKDYEVVTIIGSMSGAEKRQARIANAKAKSKAYKAAKAARDAAGGVVVTTTAAAPATVTQPAAAAPMPTGIPEPNYIEITDDMPPDELRKARIHNSKEKSKYNKALKAAGFDPKAVAAGEVQVSEAAAVPMPATQPVAAAVSVPTNIPEPNYIEITDDMPPDELRKARIHNSKEKSKYNKALKAAGIDPKALETGEAALPTATPAPVPTSEPVAAAPASVATGAPDPTLLASIPAPDYIEMTDNMSPDEKRQARIHNSKARSAYNKALKAAGIDPKSLA